MLTLLSRFLFSFCFLIAYVCSACAEPAELAAAGDLWIERKDAKTLIPELKLPSFAPAIEVLGKSVVNISTKGTIQDSPALQGVPPNFGLPQGSPWDKFLQLPREPKSRPFQSLGSGFVIHPDGYIVTNHHVVEKASKIEVSFRDEKKSYTAEVVGTDPKTDIALLKVIHPEKIPAAPLGDSDQVLSGDWAIAIGNPFYLGHTATVGIVSAVSRRVNVPGKKDQRYDSFIQTDASINPGNSGGPLFNTKGEVIGVNSVIYSPGAFSSSGFNIGIGFAIPINLVKSIITQLKEDGRVTRGWLGVLIQPVTPDVAQAMGLESHSGALVADIVPDSPADRAGFKRGDIILSYDGQKVEENEDLPIMVADTVVDKDVNVGIIRNGKKKVLKVKIAELKDEQEKVREEPDDGGQLGLSVQELTPEIARSLAVDSLKGVVVTNVEPGSPASEAGLRRGDIVLEVGTKEVNSPKEFRELTKDLGKSVPVLLLVRRESVTIFLPLRVE